MKIKWIFSLKVLLGQIFFSLPLFGLIFLAMVSHKSLNINDLKSEDLITIWIVWLSFPITIIFVGLFINKVFNQQPYPFWKQSLQTFIGFVLGCLAAGLFFLKFSSPFGLLFFLFLPVITGSIHFKNNKKELVTTLNF